MGSNEVVLSITGEDGFKHEDGMGNWLVKTLSLWWSKFSLGQDLKSLEESNPKTESLESRESPFCYGVGVNEVKRSVVPDPIHMQIACNPKAWVDKSGMVRWDSRYIISGDLG